MAYYITDKRWKVTGGPPGSYKEFDCIEEAMLYAVELKKKRYNVKIDSTREN